MTVNGAYAGLRESWLLSVRARNMADQTSRVYGRSAQQFIDYLTLEHPTAEPAGLRREHVEGFLAFYSDGRKPATVSVAYRSLQQWFAWMVEEDELDADPTERMAAPIVPEQPVPVLTEDELRALLASCEGRRLVDRRDNALLRVLIDTGGRLSEIAGLKVDDVDLAVQTLLVLGKGRRERLLPIGARTAAALDRYLRARQADARAADPGLWLGEKGKGALTSNGVYQALRRRGRAVGLPGLHPHQFRHTASHRWLADGGSETDLMQLNGWKSRSMLNRYAASAAAERARAAHRRMGLGDRL
jgi:integrase/recombinase XerC